MRLAGKIVGRAVDRDQNFGAGSATCCRGATCPHVFANIKTDANAVERKNRGCGARLEIPYFVEDAVVRQHLLAVMCEDFAILENHAGIENLVVAVVRKAQKHGNVADRIANRLDRFLDATPEAGVEQEILGRIATDTQFGKDDQVGQ